MPHNFLDHHIAVDASETAGRVLELLQNSTSHEEAYQAASILRQIAQLPQNKPVIRSLGGIQVLVDVIHKDEPAAPCTMVAVETLSFLVADDPESREVLRQSHGLHALVNLLAVAAEEGYHDIVHRVVLALRILTDRDPDRLAIVAASGLPILVNLLTTLPVGEMTEMVVAALGNMAAGAQSVKNALREAGVIPPLVRMLLQQDEMSAELAAVVLRNLSMKNPQNRSEILVCAQTIRMGQPAIARLQSLQALAQLVAL